MYKYQQIAADLRAQIRSWPPGHQLPAEAALAKRYGVVRDTVRAAVRLLQYEGILESQQGRGTFVREVRTCPTCGQAIPDGDH